MLFLMAMSKMAESAVLTSLVLTNSAYAVPVGPPPTLTAPSAPPVPGSRSVHETVFAITSETQETAWRTFSGVPPDCGCAGCSGPSGVRGLPASEQDTATNRPARNRARLRNDMGAAPLERTGDGKRIHRRRQAR